MGVFRETIRTGAGAVLGQLQTGLLTVALASLAVAQPQNPPPLIGGFDDHVIRAQEGRINWAEGVIEAVGIGRAEGTSAQQRAMATRAAEVLAARNALALARGIRVDGRGKVAQAQQGVVRVRGLVKGHRVASTQWRPEARPPEVEVTLHVPLWGVKGVGSLFVRSQWQTRRQIRASRVTLNPAGVEVDDYVVVIDARGRDLDPCLFPVIRDDSGRIVYDIVTLPAADVHKRVPARYVETGVKFEQLQSRLFIEEIDAIELAGFEPEVDEPEVDGRQGEHGNKTATSQPATNPASRPAEEGRRRARRRMAVRAVRTDARDKTQLVIPRDDAERLRKSAEASSALRKAQVIIVVDAPAAGTEGALPRWHWKAYTLLAPEDSMPVVDAIPSSRLWPATP